MRSSLFHIWCRSRSPCCRGWQLWIFAWCSVVIDSSVYILDLKLSMWLETSRFVSSIWKWEVVFRLSHSVDEVLPVGLICTSAFCRLEAPQAWWKSGILFEQNFTSESGHVVQGACRHIVKQKSLHCNFDEMPNVRLEPVADWNDKFNFYLGDWLCFLQCWSWFLKWSCPIDRPLSRWRILLVHSWQGTSVSRALSDLIFLPRDHSPGCIDSCWSCPCGKCSFLFSSILVKENDVGLILAPWLCLCIARKKNHRSVLILTTLFSGIVSRTTSCINPILLSVFVSQTTMRNNPNFSVPILFLLSTWHVCQNIFRSYCCVGLMTTCVS